jgi:hypothetical protein
MENPPQVDTAPQIMKDADYVFYELTRSICPNCRKVIDAQIVLRDNKVYMRKRCPHADRSRDSSTPTRKRTQHSENSTNPAPFHWPTAPKSTIAVPMTAGSARTTAAHLPRHHRGEQRV